MRLITCVAVGLLSLVGALPLVAAVNGGSAKVAAADLKIGSSIDLTGQWLYKPGYLVDASGKPQLETTPTAGAQMPSYPDASGKVGSEYVKVPVPQMLNRIQWWLDDSEEFKKDEAARLKKLGFDTEKAEDGWYRLNVDLPALEKGKRLFVQFDGVAMRSLIYWNGQYLGRHDGMFSRFEFDVTAQAKPGANTLAVYCSMEKIRGNDLNMGEAVTVNLTASKVRTMNKGVFGPMSPGRENREYDLHGIWQPVRLECRGPVELKDVWFNPSLSGAEVQVEVGSAQEQGYKVRAKWTDLKSKAIFAELPPQDVPYHPAHLHMSEGRTFEWDPSASTTLKLTNVQPKPWTPADPNLYELTVTLFDTAGEVSDVWTEKVGFRTFEVKGNQLYLNGQRYWLRGANHLPYGKNPTDAALARNLIQQMHDTNQRITRTHCTPWNEAWLDAANEIGLGISIEGPRPWAFAGKIGATPPELYQHWLMENEDIIRRCRNHPSVLIWCVGNEMLIRDHENVEKWKQLTGIVQQTRQLDPSRPVICTSSYNRESKFYDKVLKPNNFDDGDIDAIHSYKGWYSESNFATPALQKDPTESKHLNRPYIGQEFSTGYPDLDTGLPVLRYTVDLMTPQAWIGVRSYPGNDPKWFLDHHAIVTKRWAEQLRYTRGDNTSGFMMFANECWFDHSYDAKRSKPYPVVAAMKEAWAPIGIALESNQSRFFANSKFISQVFITNDDEEFRDLPACDLKAEIILKTAEQKIDPFLVAKVPATKYYGTSRVPVEFALPGANNPREPFTLKLTLVDAENKTWGSVTEQMELFAPLDAATVTTPSNVIIFPRGSSLETLAAGGELRARVEAGETAIVFSPGGKIMPLFPNDIQSSSTETGEFADIAPIEGTPLARDLQPMDLKWWTRSGDWRVFVASQAHRLKAGGKAKELIRFIPAHSYIRPEKVPEQVMSVLFEIPVGKGRVWVCDLDLDKSSTVDPAAQLLLRNLFAAATDPNSTKNAKVLPSHEEMLKDVLKFHKQTVGAYQKGQ